METLFPTEIILYLEVFRNCFAARNFEYFRGFMLAYMLLGGVRKSVTRIAHVCFFIDRSVSSWERFLSQYKWDLNALLKKQFSLIFAEMKEELLVEGSLLAWVDTTLVAKVKGKMPGVQKWHDHSGNPDRGSPLVGHHWALCGLVCTTLLAGKVTPLCWPLIANLISGKLNPLGFVVDPDGVARVMNFWDSVCPMLAQLQQLTNGLPMRVVADAYFAKATFINEMISLGIHVITRMRNDAVAWEDPTPEENARKKPGPKRKKPAKGKKWKLSNLLNVLPREEIEVNIYGKRRKLQIVSRDLWIRNVESQKIRFVIIKTKSKPVILATTDLTLLPKAIVQMYALRFPAELAIRDLKQNFGIGDYQSTNPTAIFRFVALAIVGFGIWRLVQLKHINADWLQEKTKAVPLSFPKLSRCLRRFTLEKLIQKSALQANLQINDNLPNDLKRLIA